MQHNSPDIKLFLANPIQVQVFQAVTVDIGVFPLFTLNNQYLLSRENGLLQG